MVTFAQAVSFSVSFRFTPVPSFTHTGYVHTEYFVLPGSALTFQVRKRVAVILREHLPDDFLPPPPIPTSLPLSVSDQGNLVENLPS